MRLAYNRVIGTGGIGSGLLFRIKGNTDIGRNESRLAELTNARDYCKQHIILHYIAKLFDRNVQTIAIGKVGKDDIGIKLLQEMSEAGIDTRYVDSIEEYPTMFSVCAQYPDKSGFNITSLNSASLQVSEDYINQCVLNLERPIDERTIVLAVPEAPVATRIFLLKKGKQNGALCVASLMAEEAEEFGCLGGFELCDLIAVNEDEARAIAGTTAKKPKNVVQLSYDKLVKANPALMLVVTFGERGSYSAYMNNTEFCPAKSVNPVNTAGAGDAFLAGVICALILGMPLQRPFKDPDGIAAPQFGVLLASISVESKHTIATEIDSDEIFDQLKIGRIDHND